MKASHFTVSKEEIPLQEVDVVQGFVRLLLDSSPLESKLVVPRKVMDLILFYYALGGSVADALKLAPKYSIVDMVYTEKPSGGTAVELQCRSTEHLPTALQRLRVDDSFIRELAHFVHGLPLRSKQQIWAHGVKSHLQGGATRVLDATTGHDQVEQLLFDVVMVYVKSMDRNGTSVKASRMKRELASLTKYIFTKYHPLKRSQFEGEQKYVAQMLSNYVSAKRTGTIHGGVGYRVRC